MAGIDKTVLNFVFDKHIQFLVLNFIHNIVLTIYNNNIFIITLKIE